MTYVKYAKRTAKKVYKKVGSLAKKRYGTFSKPKMSAIVKDLNILKSMVNAEKKHIENIQASDVAIGQINVNTDLGYYFQDITPSVAEGVTYNTRSGSSIKLHSMTIRMQIRQQANLHTSIKVQFYLIKIVGQPQAISSISLGRILVPDIFSSTTDYNSLRNPDYFRDYKVIRKWVVSIPADNYATMTNRLKDARINILFKNHHVRYSADSTTVSNGQIFIIGVADTGNTNATTASTQPYIANTAPLTGCLLNASTKSYYYDN